LYAVPFPMGQRHCSIWKKYFRFGYSSE
jgi:hypothetical protein